MDKSTGFEEDHELNEKLELIAEKSWRFISKQMKEILARGPCARGQRRPLGAILMKHANWCASSD